MPASSGVSNLAIEPFSVVYGTPSLRLDARGHQSTALFTGDIHVSSAWGVSTLRDVASSVGAGALVAESAGLIRVVSGTDAGGVSTLQTLVRLDVHPDLTHAAAIGVRLPTSPTGTQVLRWGAYDAQNGYGFGVDAIGPFLFHRSGGVTTTIRRSDWNLDRLDGSGPSGVTLDYADGIGTEVSFIQSGFGLARWSVRIRNRFGYRTLVPVHVVSQTAGPIVLDCCQPFTVEAENGVGVPAAAVEIQVNDRWAGHYGSVDPHSKRAVTEAVYGVVLAANPAWTPLIAVRRKATHGPSGRSNSVAAHTVHFEGLADASVEFRLNVGETTVGGVWGAPTDVNAAESACETKIAGFTSSGGQPFHRAMAAASNQIRATIDHDSILVLGGQREAVLFARPLTAAATTVLMAAIEWQESW